jgi:hypothetical protein
VRSSSGSSDLPLSHLNPLTGFELTSFNSISRLYQLNPRYGPGDHAIQQVVLLGGGRFLDLTTEHLAIRRWHIQE